MMIFMCSHELRGAVAAAHVTIWSSFFFSLSLSLSFSADFWSAAHVCLCEIALAS
jgi:hypothetical protein